jgi:hypothetical protein
LLNAVTRCSQLNTWWLLGRHPEGGLLDIDAVGLRSMYFVVMPRVNLIVILMTYVRYFYSINCPTVICLPNMLLFILWRDTTSEQWTPVQFPLHCYYCLLFYLLIYIPAYYYLLPLYTLSPLFTANRWDWQPHRKLGQSLGCVVCRFHVAAGEKLHADKHLSGAIVWSVTKLACINLLKFFFLLLVRLNLGFTTEGNLLLCSSYLPLGVPN